MSDKSRKMVIKKVTIITIIVFGVFFSFKAFYNAFTSHYDKATSLIKGSFNYNLDEPDKLLELPYDYQEISGLTYTEKGGVYFVIDEEGKIYSASGSAKDIELFADVTSSGDYEGIAEANGRFYIIRSDGDLHEYANSKTQEYKTPFSSKNNVEGLCYDAANNRLLIACKNKPLDDIDKDHKGVYAFDLTTKKVNKKAIFDISDKDVYGDKRKKKDHFYPSGIAVHPISKEVYLIASSGKVIFTLNAAGEVTNSKRLDPEIFKQPEGICFNEQGDMYISNEGRGGKPNILYFKYTAK